MVTISSVKPHEVREMLRDGEEIAFLDVREEGVFAEEGHPFFACSVPLSRLEVMISALVPRLMTRTVLYDGEDGLADRAAEKLAIRGYRKIAIMEGGARGWQPLAQSEQGGTWQKQISSFPRLNACKSGLSE